MISINRLFELGAWDGVNPVSQDVSEQVSPRTLGKYPKGFLDNVVKDLMAKKAKRQVLTSKFTPQDTNMTTSSVGDLNMQ